MKNNVSNSYQELLKTHFLKSWLVGIVGLTVLGCHKRDVPVESPSVEPSPQVQLAIDLPVAPSPTSIESPRELVNADDHSREILPLRVVPENTLGTALEDAESIPIEVHATEDEIQVLTKINLRDPNSENRDSNRDFFFSLPQRFRGKLVTLVRYTNRVESPEGLLMKQGRDSLLARSDLERDRFLIPFSRVFTNLEDYLESQAQPEHQQILTLELVLGGDEVHQIEIRFQLIGPLPQLQVVPQPISSVTPRERSRLAATEGWELAREELVNPYDRPFRVWLKASPEPFSLWQVLNLPTEFERLPSNLIAVRNVVRNSSQGLLRVSRVKVVGEAGRSQVVELGLSGEGYFDLAPQERVTLRWLAVSASLDQRFGMAPILRTEVFHIPDMTFIGTVAIRRFFYEQLSGQVRFACTPQFIPQAHDERVEVRWTLDQAELQGHWRREIRVAHPSSHREEAMGTHPTQGASARNLFRNFRPVSEETQSFELPEDFDQALMRPENRYSVQGVFY